MKSIYSPPHYHSHPASTGLPDFFPDSQCRCQVVVSGNMNPLIGVASTIANFANITLAEEFLIRPTLRGVRTAAASDEHLFPELTTLHLSVSPTPRQRGKEGVANALEQCSRPIWFDPAWLAEVDDTTLGEKD